MRLLTIPALVAVLGGCASEPSEALKHLHNATAGYVEARDKLHQAYCRHSPDQRKAIAWREWEVERRKPGSPVSGPVALWADLEVACQDARRP